MNNLNVVNQSEPSISSGAIYKLQILPLPCEKTRTVAYTYRSIYRHANSAISSPTSSQVVEKFFIKIDHSCLSKHREKSEEGVYTFTTKDVLQQLKHTPTMNTVVEVTTTIVATNLFKCFPYNLQIHTKTYKSQTT